jgi:hypothetical protein
MQISPSSGFRRKAWLGVLVGWLLSIGSAEVLSEIVIVAGNSWELATGGEALWFTHTRNPSHLAWFIQQFAVAFGCAVAGYIAAHLAPWRAWAVLIGLVALSLLSAFFAQLPRSNSMLVLVVFFLAPSISLAVGVAVNWRHRRNDA